jgi:hypothetical protein
MSTDRESTLEAWRAALASDEELERSDAAVAPPEDADPDDIVAALIPLLADPSDLVPDERSRSARLIPRHGCP